MQIPHSANLEPAETSFLLIVFFFSFKIIKFGSSFFWGFEILSENSQTFVTSENKRFWNS